MAFVHYDDCCLCHLSLFLSIFLSSSKPSLPLFLSPISLPLPLSFLSFLPSSLTVSQPGSHSPSPSPSSHQRRPSPSAKRDAAYVVQAGRLISQALTYEKEEEFEEAFDLLKAGVDLLLNGVQSKSEWTTVLGKGSPITLLFGTGSLHAYVHTSIVFINLRTYCVS